MPTASAALLRPAISSSTIYFVASSKVSSAAPSESSYYCSYQYSST